MEKRGSNARTIGPMSLAVSAELRAELARKGYNVQSFARYSNLPVSTLHKTLKGQRVVDVEDLFAICDALEIEPGPVVDRASAEAKRWYANGLLGEAEGMPADFSPADVDIQREHNAFEASNVARLDDHRREYVDDERAVASETSDDLGEDTDY